jgi:RsiW-degrading membrane proteinase PrsW (M82 family)
MGDRSSGRKLLYVCAFALGVLSVYPTLVLVTAEDALLGLNPNGQPLIDAIYYVFGVGLREEACKVILFLPLLPLLRKRASRLEALMCGAFVGLGFAAEENIGYFNQMDVSTAIARFLTANFLHMAMTAVVAVAVYDGDRARRGEDLSTAFPLVVGLHGAYDFFLASPVVAGQYSFVAMTVFVILSQRFLRELKVVRPSGERGGLLRHFVLSLTALAGLSYVYATTLIGPAMALQLVAGGLLGDAILIVMFVRELKEA